MRGGRALRTILVPLLTMPFWLSSAAVAGCVPPEIDVGHKFEVTPGDELSIRGRFWTDTCDDTGGDAGCGEDDFERGHPVRDIRLILAPEGEGERDGVFLAEVDADEDFEFETTIVIPDVEPGRYVIADSRGMGFFTARSIRIKAG